MGMTFSTYQTNRLLSAVLCRVSETLTMVPLPDRGRGPKLLDLGNHVISLTKFFAISASAMAASFNSAKNMGKGVPLLLLMKRSALAKVILFWVSIFPNSSCFISVDTPLNKTCDFAFWLNERLVVMKL